MQLYNTLSAKEREALIGSRDLERPNHFFLFNMQRLWQSVNFSKSFVYPLERTGCFLGRIYVAHEGINGPIVRSWRKFSKPLKHILDSIHIFGKLFDMNCCDLNRKQNHF